MKTILFAAWVIILPFFLFAQANEDSLYAASRQPRYVALMIAKNGPEAVIWARTTLDTLQQRFPDSRKPLATCQVQLGAAYLQNQEYELGIHYLNLAKVFYSKGPNAGKSVSLAALHQNIAYAYSHQRKFEQAEVELAVAKAILNDNETSRGRYVMLQVYSVLTDVLAESGQHDSLLTLTDEAIAFAKHYAEAGKDDPIIGNFHQNLGKSYYYNINNLPEAIREFEAARTQYELNETNRQLSKTNRGDILSNLGGLYFEGGDYEKAVDYCASAIHSLESDSVHLEAPAYLNAYSNIAQALLNLGEARKAEAYFQKVIEVLNKKPGASADVFATAYDGLGQAYLALKMPDAALKVHEKGLELISVRFGKNWRTAFMEYNLGADYRALGKWEQAVIHLNNAIELYHQSGSRYPKLLSQIYRSLAEIRMGQSRWEESLDLLASALAALSDPADTAQSDSEIHLREAVYLTTAQLYLQRHRSNDRQPADLNKAHQNFRLAGEWLDRDCNNLSAYNPLVLQNILEYTYTAQAVLWELYQAQPSQVLADEMFEIADRGKSRELFERFRFFNAKAELQSSFADSLRRIKDINAQMTALKSKLLAASGSFKISDPRIRYQSDIAGLKRQRDALFEWLDQKDADFAQKRRELPRISRAEVQSLLLTDQCLLEYTETDTVIYVFLIRKDRMLPPRKIPKDAQLRSWMNTVLDLCRTPLHESSSNVAKVKQRAARFGEAAYGLYRLLLEPFRLHLTKRVSIVRDGRLNDLPFEVLLGRPSQSGADFGTLPYLLHDFTFSYENSAALYREVHTRKTASSPRTLVLAPFSDLKYTKNEPFPQKSNLLPNLCSVWPCDTFWGKNATRRQLEDTIEAYRIVQLFTHAYPDTTIGQKSFILLRKPDGTLDTMFAIEIFSLPIQAEIVALSTCEASRGERRSGEGVICLAWAFTGAGARSLITTLWKAETQNAVPFIFNKFYSHLESVSRDSALRQAKLDYLEYEKTGNDAIYNTQPFYWAPFILMGENGRVKF